MQKCENMKMRKSIVFALMLTIAAQVAWAASAQDIHPAPAGAQPTVEGVIAKIDAIGEVTYPGSETAIDEAQSTYNALTEDEKALVINYGVLRTAQELYAVLEVIAKIDAIGEVTGESKALITAAREAYDALTAGQKTLVTNYAALFEAEINAIAHAYGGTIDVDIDDEKIVMVVADSGPGIPNLDLAMQEGWSTASAEVREMGYGAGMGLPNIKKNTDDLKIESTVGVGTTVTMTVFFA